jgi:hypothetical protein
MAVQVKDIYGPTMIVLAKTPGLLGSAIVSTMWFDKKYIYQTGVFKASLLESKEKLDAISYSSINKALADFNTEGQTMQASLRTENGGTGFVKFGETKE